MTQYLFTPPTVDEAPASWGNRLHIRVRIARGVTVIKLQDGSFTQQRYPAQTTLEAAQAFWLGGHVHTLEQEDRDDLVAAGYGAYITTYYEPGSYGTYYDYGDGFYGGDGATS